MLLKSLHIIYLQLLKIKNKKVGIPIIGKFLNLLQIYKSKGNVEEFKKLYIKYSNVNDKMMKIRKYIIDTTLKRSIIIQPNLYLENDNVKIKTYNNDLYDAIQ